MGWLLFELIEGWYWRGRVRQAENVSVVCILHSESALALTDGLIFKHQVINIMEGTYKYNILPIYKYKWKAEAPSSVRPAHNLCITHHIKITFMQSPNIYSLYLIIIILNKEYYKEDAKK